MNIAIRLLPPLAVIAAFALPVVLLRPVPDATPQRTRCLELPLQDERTTQTMRRAEDDIEGCLLEWNAREPGDVEMLVRLRISESHGAAKTEAGPPSPSLWLCVSEAVARVDLKVRDYIEADVFIRWTSGKLKMSIQVTKRAPPLRPPNAAEMRKARTESEALERRRDELLRELERMRAHRHNH